MINETNHIEPFLRWAGGKSWLKKHLKEIINFEEYENYHEPFLGGGSIFIYLKNKNQIRNVSYLSDNNPDLINAYQVVKQEPNNLIERLKYYKNTRDFYYSDRAIIYKNEIERAAQFIFFNRTSFNGIYRVNLRGEYNVPYGFKSYKTLFDFDNINRISMLLNNTILKVCDFEDTLKNIKARDLVFLDPPYTVAHGKNGFIKYNQKLFAWEDQIRLKCYIDILNAKGAYFILTNAEHVSINDLFNGIGQQFKLSRPNVIGGKQAERNTINEYVFTNL